MVFSSDKALQAAYAQYLQDKGHSVVVNIPIGQQGSTVDILTETEVIKCACQLTSASAVAMKSYFDFYGRFYAKWQKVVVVQEVIDPASVPLLTNAGIKLVKVPKSLEKQPVSPKATPSAKAPPYPSYPSSKPQGRQIGEGKGGLAGLLAIGLVILLGLIGMLAANSRTSTASPVSSRGGYGLDGGPDDDKMPFPRFSTGFSAFNLL
ncbi:MAG: hypothetical protein AAFY33_09820 [Cyanobacteria bacterium J06643_4]